MIWLNRFAMLTALATLALIGLGGLVTSHEAGMSVPDWPTTYGYNMFLFPVSQWVGGIFYEHTHRLWASGVGLLTGVLAVWLWVQKYDLKQREVLRWMGVAAFVGVVLQGVLGGLRVTLYKDQLGVFHAALAQLFLVLLAVIALRTSSWWERLPRLAGGAFFGKLRHWLLAASVLVLLQLVLGAAMRHQHAGLAVPDFPWAYGRVWPPTDAAFLAGVNAARIDARDFKDITAFQIYLHLAHRLSAALILGLAGALARRCVASLGWRAWPSGLALGWLGAILAQGTLGAWTVWSNKAADITTLHVVTGASILVYGALLTVMAFRQVHAAGSPTSEEGDHDKRKCHSNVGALGRHEPLGGHPHRAV